MLTREDYDTKDGMRRMAQSLQGLNLLIEARGTAGYRRNERLGEFFVLGRWWADTCGNFSGVSIDTNSSAKGLAPKDCFTDMPDVLTKEEFWNFCKLNGKEDVSIASRGRNDVPPCRVECQGCHVGWAIEDCHDVIVPGIDEETVDLSLFVGIELGKVCDLLETRRGVVWMRNLDGLMRNDRFIDLSPDPGSRGRWPKNEHGWQRIEFDGYVVQQGDETFFNVRRYYHRKCYAEKIEREYRERFEKVFADAGFQDVTLISMASQYCPCEKCAPWFEAQTALGKFTIGWRKRVINIDRGDIGIDLAQLFVREDVTKGSNYIHAWGWDKAVEYLKVIRDAVVSTPSTRG
jgi:hypothetical protein